MARGLAVEGVRFRQDVSEPSGVASVEYKMMSRLKSRLMGWSSAPVLAVVLIVFSFASGTMRASAEDLESAACSEAANAMDYSMEMAEALDVLCHSAIDTAQPLADEIPQPVADAILPSAVEGQAIRVEITQTVTIAVIGDEEPEITGSVPSIDGAAEAKAAAKPETGVYRLVE